VQRKWSLDGQTDFICLIELIATSHHDEDIDIAIGVRLAVGVRAEEDDLFGVEKLGDFACEAMDGRLRHLRAAVPAVGLWLRSVTSFGGHICILS
jgi:hypothetical protein